MPKNKTLKETVAQNLKTLMTTKKLGQAKVVALAKKSGARVDQTTVSRVARAVYPATLDTIEAIAKGCGVPPWQLLLESGTASGLLELLRAWEQSGEQGKKLLALAAKGALERDSFEAADGGGTIGVDGIAQPRRGSAA